MSTAMGVSSLIEHFTADVSKYGNDYSCPYSFQDWFEKIRMEKDPNSLRSLLYFGFQPLLDALIAKSIDKKHRKGAVRALDEIMEISASFLHGFYVNENFRKEDKPFFSGDIFSGIENFVKLNVNYNTKSRNIGMYQDQCLPEHIQMFLKSTVRMIESGTIPKPSYIIGCACGASELVLPLARLLGIPYDFIRKSKRREDASPVVLPEHQKRIIDHAEDETVFVVEDFVCTGRTILSVMKQMETFKASQVIGLSMCRNLSDSLTSRLKQIAKGDQLYAFLENSKE